MIRTLFISTVLALATPGLAMAQEDHAGHKHDHGAHQHHEAHDDGRETETAAAEKAPATLSAKLAATPEIAAALAKGGDAAVVDVLGAVCDFCATAMNKTFGKRAEVAAIYVDLDAKTLSIVFEPGAGLDDETIDALVTKAGYRIAAIHRSADIAEAGIAKGPNDAADPS